MASDGSVPAKEDQGEPEPVALSDPHELHFWGLPTDVWATAQVGRISVFYTSGLIVFACGEEYTDIAWDVACDLYLPSGLAVEHGTSYVYCPWCRKEFFYFEL